MLSVPLGTFLSFLLCCSSAWAWIVTSCMYPIISPHLISSPHLLISLQPIVANHGASFSTDFEEYITTLQTATTNTAAGITRSEYAYTDIINVSPTATSYETRSVETTVDYYYSDLTVVAILIPTGAGVSVSVSHSLPPQDSETDFVAV